MIEVTETKKDPLQELWEQFMTVRDALQHIRNGAAIITLNTPVGSMEVDDIFESPGYMQQLEKDFRNYKVDLAEAIIEEMTDVIKQEADAAMNPEVFEPFPIGTPKADHRRSVMDADDGK